MSDSIITKKELPRLISESSKELKRLEVLALEKIKPILLALREKDCELLTKELGIREVYLMMENITLCFQKILVILNLIITSNGAINYQNFCN